MSFGDSLAQGLIAVVKSPAFMASFNVRVYKNSRRFSVPKQVCDALGIGGGDSVRLIIRNASGEELFNGRKELRSGLEIYGKGLSKLTPDSTIFIEASEPSTYSEAKAEAQSFNAQERAAGFQADLEIRRVVEKYAMKRAKEKLSTNVGFSDFHDTSEHECYDYICKRDGRQHYVEVKGTQGSGASVILTKNEVEHWRSNQECSIAVIVHDVKVNGEKGSRSASGGTLHILFPWVLESKALEPVQFKWAVSGFPDFHNITFFML